MCSIHVQEYTNSFTAAAKVDVRGFPVTSMVSPHGRKRCRAVVHVSARRPHALDQGTFVRCEQLYMAVAAVLVPPVDLIKLL